MLQLEMKDTLIFNKLCSSDDKIIFIVRKCRAQIEITIGEWARLIAQTKTVIATPEKVAGPGFRTLIASSTGFLLPIIPKDTAVVKVDRWCYSADKRTDRRQ